MCSSLVLDVHFHMQLWMLFFSLFYCCGQCSDIFLNGRQAKTVCCLVANSCEKRVAQIWLTLQSLTSEAFPIQHCLSFNACRLCALEPMVVALYFPLLTCIFKERYCFCVSATALWNDIWIMEGRSLSFISRCIYLCLSTNSKFEMLVTESRQSLQWKKNKHSGLLPACSQTNR